MFSRIYTASFFALLLGTFAAATPASAGFGNGGNRCHTGNTQCCNSIVNAADNGMSDILNFHGVIVQNTKTDIGVNCSPFNHGGKSGSTCESNVVCCEDNSHALFSTGCSSF